MKGDTNCAERGNMYPLHDKNAKNAKKQWNDISMTTQPESRSGEAQDLLPRLFLTTENPKPTFLAQQQRLYQMDQKIKKQGRAVAQLRERYDEFWKLVALKQGRLKLQQELSSLDANSTELLVLPQPDTVSDEKVNVELNALLALEQAIQTARKQMMALGFAANPTLVAQARREAARRP